MATRPSAVWALLALASACERPESTTRSEPVGETIAVAPAPKADEPTPAEQRPAASVPAPEASADATVRRPINPRELPPPVPVPVRRKATWFSQLTAEQKRDMREACEIKRLDPCAGLMPRPMMKGDGPPEPDRYSALMARFDGADRERGERWCRANHGVGVCDTPIVIAFETGAPIELVPATGATFAFRPDRAPSATAWPTAATPWLALDRDGDGAITSGAELFGDAVAAHGFAALAELDANRDGVIDARDPMFAALLLWTDRDGDRASTPGELAPAALTIASISLAYETPSSEGPRSRVTLRDGRAGAAVDLYLRSR